MMGSNEQIIEESEDHGIRESAGTREIRGCEDFKEEKRQLRIVKRGGGGRKKV